MAAPIAWDSVGRVAAWADSWRASAAAPEFCTPKTETYQSKDRPKEQPTNRRIYQSKLPTLSPIANSQQKVADR